jgi:dipeptidase
MLFGKNSDRQRNEAQAVELLPGADHDPGADVRCTYITIPQVRRTHAVLLCRPFWLWGAEMGANEHGVVIGNEGLHARTGVPLEQALTGMDILRLGLERAATAEHAVEIMTTLLEQHGQGGNCGHLTPLFYHNGFMVADAREAFVVETVGREWLVERVRGVRSMSNRYSIDRQPERSSAGLTGVLRELGSGTGAVASYSQLLADPGKEHLGNAAARRDCTTSLLQSMVDRIEPADMMKMLREHGAGHRFHPQWRAECTIRRTVCMHAGADDRPGQTVGSLVSELRGGDSVHWVTGTAAPCISIFKPILVDAPLPAHGPPPTDRFDPNTLWWRHERLHRAALRGDFAEFLEQLRPERDALENEFRTQVRTVMLGGSQAERARVVNECWSKAMTIEDGWQQRISGRIEPSADSSCWAQMSRLAGLT